MRCKCLGCGTELQNIDKKNLGYVQDLNSKYCERCFRIKNYSEYQKVEKNSEDFYKIIDNINETGDLTVLVVDLFSIGEELFKLSSKLNNKPLIVVSKRDIFSYKINDEKLLNIIDLPCVDKICASSNKNYNFDLLMEKINKYKKSNNVYVIGLTNSGKSTLINKIIYNYTDLDSVITTSMLPSTTLDTIEIKINENLTLIDTPGIIDEHNITNYLEICDLKKIFPKKEIKPITYQIKCKQYILVNDFIKIECLENCDMTLYFSNQLNIDRVFKDIPLNFNRKELEVLRDNLIIINGLGFIKVNSNTKFNIYTYDNVEIYIK